MLPTGLNGVTATATITYTKWWLGGNRHLEWGPRANGLTNFALSKAILQRDGLGSISVRLRAMTSRWSPAVLRRARRAVTPRPHIEGEMVSDRVSHQPAESSIRDVAGHSRAT